MTTGGSTRETIEVARRRRRGRGRRGRDHRPQRRAARARRAASRARCELSLPTYQAIRLPALRPGLCRSRSPDRAAVANDHGDSQRDVRVAELIRVDARFKLTLAYDGTDFVGLAAPGHRPLGAGAARGRARRASKARRSPSAGAGRTDAGVHALGQVASVTLTHAIRGRRARARSTRCCRPTCACSRSSRAARRLPRALLRRAPRPIATHLVGEPVLSPFERRVAWHVPGAARRRRHGSGRARARGRARLRRVPGRPAATTHDRAGSLAALDDSTSLGPSTEATSEHARLRGDGRRLPAPHGARIVGTLVEVGRGRRRVPALRCDAGAGRSRDPARMARADGAGARTVPGRRGSTRPTARCGCRSHCRPAQLRCATGPVSDPLRCQVRERLGDCECISRYMGLLEQLLEWVPPGPRGERSRASRTSTRCRRTSPSSWTATGAGRRSAICRGSRGTGPASTRCATSSRPRRASGIEVLTLYAFSVENWKRPRVGGQRR